VSAKDEGDASGCSPELELDADADPDADPACCCCRAIMNTDRQAWGERNRLELSRPRPPPPPPCGGARGLGVRGGRHERSESAGGKVWGGGGGEGKGGIATGARVFAFRWRAGLLVLREPSAFWLPGPGAALLFFAERRRRRRDLSNGSRGCCEMEWVRGAAVVSKG